MGDLLGRPYHFDDRIILLTSTKRSAQSLKMDTINISVFSSAETLT